VILIPILALIVGIIVGGLLNVDVHGFAPYLGVAVVAGLDSVFGGSRSAIEGKFRTDVFVTGFLSNIVISVGLLWLGSKIKVDLFLVIALVLGTRIFNNLSVMRRMGLTYLSDLRAKRQREELTAKE
jgi:small basic protein